MFSPLRSLLHFIRPRHFGSPRHLGPCICQSKCTATKEECRRRRCSGTQEQDSEQDAASSPSTHSPLHLVSSHILIEYEDSITADRNAVRAIRSQLQCPPPLLRAKSQCDGAVRALPNKRKRDPEPAAMPSPALLRAKSKCRRDGAGAYGA
jgi:hypothetical protein